MNNIFESGYFILSFNYAIVFFATMVIIYFFASTLFRVYRDRVDFNNILSISDKICVKFDYNGAILDYNVDFERIATINNENVRGEDLFTLIQFDKYDDMIDNLFNSTVSEDNSFITKVVCKNGDVKKIRFRGIENSNYFGAGVSYILVGTDITLLEKNEKEYKFNKSLLESLTTDYRFAEEELKRNFLQIHNTQEDLDELRIRHANFVDNLPLGIVEYDFDIRQIHFSNKVVRYFIPNASANSVHVDEVIIILYNFIKKESAYDMLESFYSALQNKSPNFSYVIEFNNGGKVNANGTITYNKQTNEPNFLYVILDSF